MIGFLLVTGLIFVAVGLRALYDPVGALTESFGMQLVGVSAMNHARASAGGVALVIGLYMLASLKYVRLSTGALAACALVLGGLVFGRCISFFVDGSPSITVWVSFSLEFFGFVQAVHWLRQEMKTD